MTGTVGRWKTLQCVAGAGVAAVLIVSIAARAQTVFTWTDDSGVVHFSDSPPAAGQKYEQRGAEPVEPILRHSADAANPAPGADSGAPAAPAAPAEAPASDTAPKGPARVILTSKEASPRGPETRHVIGSV